MAAAAKVRDTTVGGVEDPLFDLCEWYLLLCSFYPPPRARSAN